MKTGTALYEAANRDYQEIVEFLISKVTFNRIVAVRFVRKTDNFGPIFESNLDFSLNLINKTQSVTHIRMSRLRVPQ